jgi:hypothetical protein
MKKIVRLKESDLSRIITRVINEQPQMTTGTKQLPLCSKFKNFISGNLGYFYPEWDSNGMILIARSDFKLQSNPDYPLKKDTPFCQCD